MDQTTSYHSELNRMKMENEYLKSELEEYVFREKILKKELEIMNQLTHQRSTGQVTAGKEHQEDISQLRLQNVDLKRQKEKLQILNKTYIQNINDLRFNNAELKNLSQKISRVHEKELQIMKKESLPHDYLLRDQKERRLVKEKDVLEKKLDSCAAIAKEMEQYYLNQIRRYKEMMKDMQEQNRVLLKDLEGITTQRGHLGPHEGIMKSVNEKWQKQVMGLKQSYENEIKELKNKIKFLINKIEKENDDYHPIKISVGSISHQQMIQSKLMIQSTSSNQSSRFTPISSVSSFKDYPTRRKNSGMNNPNEDFPSQRNIKNNGALGDRSNY